MTAVLDAPADPAGAGAGPVALSRAHWQAAAAAVSGNGRMVVSFDGGRTYPVRGDRDRPLADVPPPQPATVFVYDPVLGTGQALVCDFDVKRARAADPVAAVAADAAGLVALVDRAGGRCLQDLSPGGGRHVYVLWDRPQHFTELKRLCNALARRYPSLDPSPMSRLTGLIRPPGSRYKAVGGRSPGWQLLVTPLEQVPAIISGRCGPQVWNALHGELVGELADVDARDPGLAVTGPLDSKGTAWIPGPGPRRPLSPQLAEIARTGRYPDRYASGSEARMAVLCSAAARGWHLHQVNIAMTDGSWPGMARLYQRYPATSRPGAVERDWKKAVARVGAEKNAAASHTRHQVSHAPGSLPSDSRAARAGNLTIDEQIWVWRNAVWLAERDPARIRSWGGAAASIRLTLRALAAAMQMTKSAETEFGTRDLALHAKIAYRTVAQALARLRDEDDPLIVRTRTGRGLLGDRYRMRVPGAYRDDVLWYRWRAGVIAPVHSLFRVLGPTAMLTWEALGSQRTPVAELARLAVLSTSAAGRALLRLGEYGLAVRDGGGWARGPATLDEAAAAVGAWRLEEEVRAEHDRHRDVWRRRLSNRPGPPGEAPAPAPVPARPAAAPPRAPAPGGVPQRAPPDLPGKSAALRLLIQELGAEVLSVEDDPPRQRRAAAAGGLRPGR